MLISTLLLLFSFFFLNTDILLKFYINFTKVIDNIVLSIYIWWNSDSDHYWHNLVTGASVVHFYTWIILLYYRPTGRGSDVKNKTVSLEKEDEVLDCGKPVNFTYYDNLVGVANRLTHPNVPESQVLCFIFFIIWHDSYLRGLPYFKQNINWSTLISYFINRCLMYRL